jgi:hypothetical protein
MLRCVRRQTICQALPTLGVEPLVIEFMTLKLIKDWNKYHVISLGTIGKKRDDRQGEELYVDQLGTNQQRSGQEGNGIHDHQCTIRPFGLAPLPLAGPPLRTLGSHGIGTGYLLLRTILSLKSSAALLDRKTFYDGILALSMAGMV